MIIYCLLIVAFLVIAAKAVAVVSLRDRRGRIIREANRLRAHAIQNRVPVVDELITAEQVCEFLPPDLLPYLLCPSTPTGVHEWQRDLRTTTLIVHADGRSEIRGAGHHYCVACTIPEPQEAS